jgi:DNA-directed RNA polymerase specialized sigma24 family protein
VSTLPDDQLAEQVARGEEQTLLHLYDRHAGRVYALVLRMLGDPMSAEEITQDVFFKVWSRAQLPGQPGLVFHLASQHRPARSD